MKRFPFCFLSVLSLLPSIGLEAAPVVTNLTASQRSGTQLVDIAFDLAAPGFPAVAVALEISSDAGATWTVPAVSSTGDLGASVAPGLGKSIVWDAEPPPTPGLRREGSRGDDINGVMQ